MTTIFTQLIMKRVRQIDIAEALQLDRSTVSKALKGDPAIAEATRRRVREAAQRLQFRPDPMLTALAHYRKRGREAYRSTIAWVNNYPRSTSMEMFPGFADYYRGAEARCGELGYQLEPLWIDGSRLNVRRLPEVLKARGIRAVVFAPQAAVGVHMPFPMEDFCVVAIGYSLVEPAMDIVTNDHFATMTDILERLRRDGHERIGCYLWDIDNERMGRRARSAFLAYSSEYNCCVHTYREFEADVFTSWIRENRLDAVVCRGLAQAGAWRRPGKDGPQSVRFVGYAIEADERQLSGMSHNNLLIGVRAAEWVSSKLERGQFGATELPQRLLVSSQWIDNG